MVRRYVPRPAYDAIPKDQQPKQGALQQTTHEDDTMSRSWEYPASPLGIASVHGGVADQPCIDDSRMGYDASIDKPRTSESRVDDGPGYAETGEALLDPPC